MEGGHQSTSGPECRLDRGIPSAGVRRNGCWPLHHFLMEGWGRQQQQPNNLGPRSYKWLHSMLNVGFTVNRIPKVWRQSKIIAILKPGKDSAIPKNYIHISLLGHMYQLYYLQYCLTYTQTTSHFTTEHETLSMQTICVSYPIIHPSLR